MLWSLGLRQCGMGCGDPYKSTPASFGGFIEQPTLGPTLSPTLTEWTRSDLPPEFLHRVQHHSAAMRGHFSIEWMAQSSQPAGSEVTTASELTACGTTSESLPGFYCRPKSHRVLEQKEDGSGRRVDTYKPSSLQHQASLNTQGKSRQCCKQDSDVFQQWFKSDRHL